MRDAYDQVYVYAMEHGGEAFILQHVVDAFGAQTAGAGTKSIRLVFALVGLYLHVEKQFSGRQVQQVHMQLGRQKRRWPVIPLPIDRGNMTVFDVLAVAPGPDREVAITAWCRSVWEAFRDSRQTVVHLLQEHRII